MKRTSRMQQTFVHSSRLVIVCKEKSDEVLVMDSPVKRRRMQQVEKKACVLATGGAELNLEKMLQKKSRGFYEEV